MATVQESEAALVTELEDFLEAELDFVNQYHGILRDLKSQWGAGFVTMLCFRTIAHHFP